MELYFTESFKGDYRRLSRRIQTRLDKQLVLLLENPRHPSLQIKKMRGHSYIWEGRITRDYRFTFQIEKNVYVLRRTGSHPILRNP